MDESNTGKYIGYTLGDNKPTLYFERGRITQIHNDNNNIGWHPVISEDHIRFNINAAKAAEFDSIPEGSPQLDHEFCQHLIDNRTQFESNAENAVLFECYTDQDGLLIPHVSRSKLIMITDDNYNGDKYNIAYILNVRSGAQLAPNEN